MPTQTLSIEVLLPSGSTLDNPTLTIEDRAHTVYGPVTPTIVAGSIPEQIFLMWAVPAPLPGDLLPGAITEAWGWDQDGVTIAQPISVADTLLPATPRPPVAPMPSNAEIFLLQGADYYDLDGRALVWSDATWPSLVGASVEWRYKRWNETAVAVSFACAVVDAATVRLELSAAQTATIPYSQSEIRDRYEIWAVLTTGHNVRLAHGPAFVEA